MLMVGWAPAPGVLIVRPTGRPPATGEERPAVLSPIDRGYRAVCSRENRHADGRAPRPRASGADVGRPKRRHLNEKPARDGRGEAGEYTSRRRSPIDDNLPRPARQISSYVRK
jgi:hypothetical protein